jgi:hypothetical protein
LLNFRRNIFSKKAKKLNSQITGTGGVGKIGMTIATTSSSKLSDHRKGHVAIESTTTIICLGFYISNPLFEDQFQLFCKILYLRASSDGTNTVIFLN